MSDLIIENSVAVDEYDRWIEANDIDTDLDGMDENERADITRNRAIIIRAIERGKVAIDENGDAIFSPKDGDPIKFVEPKGSSYVAMDKKKKSSEFGKMFACMADMCGVSAVRFSKMKQSDLKVCMALWSTFLV